MRFLLAALLALFAAAPAHAHFRTHQYSFGDAACSRIVDPIGAVFYGGGDFGRSREHVRHHTGWGSVVVTSPQWFFSHGACRAQNGENASGSWWETRYHLRFRQTLDWDAYLGYTTEATPHYEEALACGHATRSYDAARRLLAERMAAGGHATWFEYWATRRSSSSATAGRPGATATCASSRSSDAAPAHRRTRRRSRRGVRRARRRSAPGA